MSFRFENSRSFIEQINREVDLHFEEMTCDIDLFDTAVGEYDGIILQLLFPNPEAGCPKFQLLKTDIALPESTSYFKDGAGQTDLTVQEVISLINSYIKEAEMAYKRKWNPSD